MPFEPQRESPLFKPHASPSIRKFARELGVDLAKVKGSGPKGRITQQDVQAFVKGVLQPFPNVIAMAPKDEDELADMMFTASFTMGTPVTFEMNGTVREARGLTSMTKTPGPPGCAAGAMTYCTFISPRTCRASAMRVV